MADPLTSGVGPIPPGSLTQAWGASGAGKTSLALALLRSGDVFVDAEGLIAGRLQAVGAHAKRLLVARPRDFETTLQALEKAAIVLERRGASRVVVDGLLHHWRFERLADMGALAQALARIHRLKGAARGTGGTVVFTNQATAGPTGEPRPVGGQGILHLSDIVVRLEPVEAPWVRLTLEKHPSRAAGSVWEARVRDGLLSCPAAAGR